MPPVSMTSVWQAARIASGVANLMVFAIQVPDDDARLDQLEQQDQRCEQDQQRDRRLLAQAPPPVPGRSSGGSPRRRVTLCCRRRMSQPPTMTTMTMIPPLDDGAEVGVDAEEDQVLADEREDERGGERAEQAAPAPREAHAAEHDGGDGGERVVRGDRRADAGRHRQGEAATRREQPGQHVRRDLRPLDLDAAPERRQPVAADRVQRQAQARAAERQPDHRDDDDEDDERPWAGGR